MRWLLPVRRQQAGKCQLIGRLAPFIVGGSDAVFRAVESHELTSRSREAAVLQRIWPLTAHPRLTSEPQAEAGLRNHDPRLLTRENSPQPVSLGDARG